MPPGEVRRFLMQMGMPLNREAGSADETIPGADALLAPFEAGSTPFDMQACNKMVLRLNDLLLQERKGSRESAAAGASAG